MKAIRRWLYIWRCGRAFSWVIYNNAEMVRASRTTPLGGVIYGCEVRHRGQRFFSCDPLRAVEYARELRMNPHFVDCT